MGTAATRLLMRAPFFPSPFQEKKTCITILKQNLLRRHEINASYLRPLRLQAVLKVMAISFQTLIVQSSAAWATFKNIRSSFPEVCIHFLPDSAFVAMAKSEASRQMAMARIEQTKNGSMWPKQ